MQLAVVLWVFVSVLFAGQADFECEANAKPIGSHWTVDVSLEGRVNSTTRAATIRNVDGYLGVIYEGNDEDPFAESSFLNRTIQSDPFYHPVKYSDHYRFELPFKKTSSYSGGQADFIFPKHFRGTRTRAYLILSGINDTFGGTVALKCTVNDN